MLVKSPLQRKILNNLSCIKSKGETATNTDGTAETYSCLLTAGKQNL